MNALRQFVTTTDGNVYLNLPPEYRQRQLEIIILPADDTTPSTADELGEAMDKMSDTAQKMALLLKYLTALDMSYFIKYKILTPLSIR